MLESIMVVLMLLPLFAAIWVYWVENHSVEAKHEREDVALVEMIRMAQKSGRMLEW